MPTLSIFYGVVIKIYHRDHNPPHFHALYGDFEAVITIRKGQVIHGHLPPRVIKLINEWRRLHLFELVRAWEDVKNYRSPQRIKPLE